MEKKRFTLAIMVDNESGVLSRVSSLFSRKGYNIESIAAGTLETPNVTRITIEVLADDDNQINLLCNQVRKLIPVHSVKLLNNSQSIRRELVLIKDPESVTGFSEVVDSVLSQRFDSDKLLILHTRRAKFFFDEPVSWTRDGEAGGEHRQIELCNHKAAIDMIF